MKTFCMRNLGLVTAAITLAGSVSQAQVRRHIPVAGQHFSTVRSPRAHNPNSGTGLKGSSIGGFPGYLSHYAPYLFGPSYTYSMGGALVIGPNGQNTDPFGTGGLPSVGPNGVVMQAPAQSSDQIDAFRLPSGAFRIVWNGDTRPISSLKFSILDRSRVTLATAVVTDPPAQATFPAIPNAAFYRVVIVYGDGATRALVAPL